MQLEKSFVYSSDFPIYTFFYLSYFLCNSYFFLRIVQNYLFKLVRNPRAIRVKNDGQHVPCRCNQTSTYMVVKCFQVAGLVGGALSMGFIKL